MEDVHGADAPVGSGGATGDRAERMGEVARRIGHDLNNCLGIVGGRAELARMQLDKGDLEAARRGIDAILGQMERMKVLSDSLRELRHRP